ncbi:packaged DNA stabilization protein [Aquirhabdus parva]|uniref:Uncharacterized protein n=1 Tax=Aquirhabdus parva TaxID=2283318 RepID=A0A345P2B7_9GAMM|nr:packaged DNA stabilization protein [Aquirhabdus parva]AXI01426.1 hypothetical protein HYN46_00025 [Aquirhabdus parva]AXI04372.1 hypothetical protein HYN46_16940 [Aquirhabdus parva]
MAKLPIVGAAYKNPSLIIDCQNTINWYPQAIELPNGAQRVSALIPTPGLIRRFTGDSAAVRCLKVLSTGQLLAVIGKKLYHSPANTFNLTQVTGVIMGLDIVSIADNGTVAMIVNGNTNQVLDLKTLVLTTLTGSNIPRSSFVVFLDGRFVMNKEKSDRFVWSDLYSTNIDALSYATAEASPDPMVALVEFQRELWMFGTQTTERYYSNNDKDQPFARMPGGVFEMGCLAPNSVCAFGTGIIWLAVSEFGGNQIVMSSGGQPVRLSNHAIEGEIDSYPTNNDAVAFAYQQEGHSFYVISFPSGNTTFVFDMTTQLWHQRSWTNTQGQHDRHRAHIHAYFNGTHYVGDYSNGKIYELDRGTYTDDGNIITRERTCPATLTDGQMMRFTRLEIVCETGDLKKRGIPPDLEIHSYTSQPYPYMFNDVFKVGGSLTGISLRPNFYTIPAEIFRMGASLTAINLPVAVTYGTYNIPPEAFKPSASMTAIDMPILVSYGTYNIPAEAFKPSASMSAISLPIVASYLTYSIPAEPFNIGASLTGVTLA